MFQYDYGGMTRGDKCKAKQCRFLIYSQCKISKNTLKSEFLKEMNLEFWLGNVPVGEENNDNGGNGPCPTLKIGKYINFVIKKTRFRRCI